MVGPQKITFGDMRDSAACAPCWSIARTIDARTGSRWPPTARWCEAEWRRAALRLQSVAAGAL